MSASAPRRLLPWFHLVPLAAAAVAALVGALALAGWAYEVETLKSVLPGLTSMKVNTAAGFILAGIALAGIAAEGRGRALRMAAQACAALVLLLGLATLTEGVTGADLGIDQLLARDVTHLPGDIPGRMALNTAISFAALGAALLLLSLRRVRLGVAIHLLATVPLILGGSALIGYGYDIEDFLRQRINYTPMALHTGLAFVLLAFGVMNARPEFPLPRFVTAGNPAGVMVRRLLPAAIAFTLLAGWLIERAARTGYLNAALTLALFAAVMIAGLAVMILANAGSLYKIALQRERMEKTLQENEERLNTVLDLLPVGVWILGPDGGVTYSNEAARGIWRGVRYVEGKRLGEYKGWRVNDGTRVQAHEWAGARAVATGETTVQEEVEIECFDGTHKFILDSAVPLLAHDGTRRGAVTVNQDITQRRLAEEAARRQAAQYATLLATTTDGFWRYKADGVLLEVNDAYCHMSGYTREELLSMSIPQIEAVESPEDVARHIRHVQETGFDRFESRHRKKNGEVWDVEVSLSNWPQARELIAFLRDLTERKRTEAINAVRLHLVEFAQTHTVDELLEETLNQAENLTGSLIGFYHFVEDDQNSLTLQTWSTRTKREFCRAEGKGLHYPIDEAGVWADCAREGRPVIHNDYAALPNRKGMPEGHAAVLREAVVPVRRGARLSAILGVGNKPTDYTDADVETLLMIADLTGEIAARKRAEEALREREERLRLLAETIQDVFWISTPGVTQMLYISPAYERLWERTCDSLYRNPKSFGEPVHPDDLPALGRIFELHAQGMPYEVEYRIVRRNGEVRWMHERGYPVRNDDGSVRAMTGVVSDITARKQAEEALRASEERFRALADATSEGMLIHDHGRIVEANRQMEDLLRRARHELIGAALLDLIAPEARARIRERVEQPKDERVEFPFVRPDGSEVFVSGLARGCTYQGRPMRVAAYRDITVEKRAEEAMRTVGIYNRTLLEVSLDPLVTINADGKISDVNEATVQATGVPRSVLIGSDFSDYFTEPERARAGYQEVFARGFVMDYPLTLRHTSGKLMEVLYNATIYRNAKGEVAGVFATARDVTERRKLERELQRQAHIDLLTDLNNRRHFMELAEQEMARAKRHNEVLSLLIMDIDHFKRVNDTHGHQAGDLTLQKLSAVFRRTFREMDIVGRLGGEEFTALLPETAPEQAMEVAERLREAVEHASLTLEDGTVLHFTISIGVARVEPADTELTAPLKRADAALYQAKSSGRNRVCLAAPPT